MTQKTNKDDRATESQIEQVLGLVEQLKSEFQHERAEMQAKIANLEVRLNEQKTAQTNTAIAKQEQSKTSRRRMLRQLGAAAAGIAAIGVATGIQPEAAQAAPSFELNVTTNVVTAPTEVTHNGGGATQDTIVARAAGGAGLVGISTGQGSGMIGYQGDKATIDTTLGIVPVGDKKAGVTGASIAQPGVQGVSQNSAGVRAVSTLSFGVVSRGGWGTYLRSTGNAGSNGQLVLAPGATPGPVVTGEHYLGELYLDSNYNLWVLTAGGSTVPDTFAPVNPDALPNPFPPTAENWKLLNGGGGVVGGVKSVNSIGPDPATGNVVLATLPGMVRSVNGAPPDGNGNVATPTGTVKSVNGTAPDGAGNVTLTIPTPPGGIVFLSTPIRVAASTNSGGTQTLLSSSGNPNDPTAGGASRDIQITGVTINGVSVPAGAKGIFGALTAVRNNAPPTIAGNMRIWPDGGPTPTVNSLNIPFPLNQSPVLNLTTSFIVGLSAAGKVRIVFNNGTAGSNCGFSIDVGGYFS